MAAPTCTDVCCSDACLRGAKAGFVLLLTLAAAACTVVGVWIGRHAKAMHMASALAAGVFLSSALVHILPHAAGLLSGEEHGDEEHGGHEKFPVANAVTLAVFLALVFVEGVLLDRFSHGSHGHGAGCHAHAPPAAAAAADVPVPHGVDAGGAAHAAGSPGEVDVEGGGQGEGGLGGRGKGGRDPFMTPALLSAGVLVSAISIHSLLESISFGLALDFPSALTLFIAISAHRCIECTAVLARLASSPGLRAAQRHALYLAFVLVLPVGAVIGATLSSLPPTVEGVFVAMSGGAFIYLGAEGVFAEFGHRGRWKGAKYSALVVGAGLIVAVEATLYATGNVA